MQSFCYAVHN